MRGLADHVVDDPFGVHSILLRGWLLTVDNDRRTSDEGKKYPKSVDAVDLDSSSWPALPRSSTQ
jgi:hypothetical protein